MSEAELCEDDGEIIKMDCSLENLPTDALVHLLEGVQQEEQRAREQRLRLLKILTDRSPRTDGCKTTRLRGEKRIVKIEWPDDSWDQSVLREAWSAYPAIAGEFLSVASYRVRLSEWKKAQHTQGDGDFAAFVQLLRVANRGPQGAPRIVIER